MAPMSVSSYTPIATMLSKRGRMLRVSAVITGDAPSVSIEMRKSADLSSKPDGKLTIGLDSLQMVLMAMARAGDVASSLAEKATGAKPDRGDGVVAVGPGAAFINAKVAEALSPTGGRADG